MSLPEGWYCQVHPGQSYLEKDISLGSNEERVVTVISPARGRFIRPAWRILVREPSGEVLVKEPYFFGGGLKRIV